MEQVIGPGVISLLGDLGFGALLIVFGGWLAWLGKPVAMRAIDAQQEQAKAIGGMADNVNRLADEIESIHSLLVSLNTGVRTLHERQRGE